MKLFSFFLDDVSITFDYIPFFFVNNFQTIDILLGFCNRFLFSYFPVGYISILILFMNFFDFVLYFTACKNIVTYMLFVGKKRCILWFEGKRMRRSIKDDEKIAMKLFSTTCSCSNSLVKKDWWQRWDCAINHAFFSLNLEYIYHFSYLKKILVTKELL